MSHNDDIQFMSKLVCNLFWSPSLNPLKCVKLAGDVSQFTGLPPKAKHPVVPEDWKFDINQDKACLERP